MLQFIKRIKKTFLISLEEIKIIEDNKEILTEKREYVLINKDIEKLKKYIKKGEVDIILEEDIFFYTEVVDKEKSEYINIKKYIKNEVLPKFSEEKENYYFCYFQTEEGAYELFVGEDKIIKNFIEFLIKYNIKVSGIFLSSTKKYEILDFKQVLKFNKDPKINKKILFTLVLIGFFFIGNNIYEKKLVKRNNQIKKMMYEKERILNENKFNLEEIKKRIKSLEEKEHGKNIGNEKFQKKIMWIIEEVSSKIKLEYLHYEKNNLILKGQTKSLKKLFIVILNLEKNREIEKLTYDYILKKENMYEYLLELKVK